MPHARTKTERVLYALVSTTLPRNQARYEIRVVVALRVTFHFRSLISKCLPFRRLAVKRLRLRLLFHRDILWSITHRDILDVDLASCSVGSVPPRPGPELIVHVSHCSRVLSMFNIKHEVTLEGRHATEIFITGWAVQNADRILV